MSRLPVPAALLAGAGIPLLLAAQPAPDLAIDRIEVLQTVQRVDDEIHQVPLVAGKKTVARVFLRSMGSDARPISDITGTLSAEGLAGELRPWIVAGSAATAPAGPSEPGDLRHSLQFVLPDAWTRTDKPVRLTARVRLEGNRTETNTGNNEKSVTVSFRGAPGWPEVYRVAWLPVCVRQGSGELACPANSFRDADLLVRKLLPLPDSAFGYRPVLAPPVVCRDRDARSLYKLLAVQLNLYDTEAGTDGLAAWLPAGLIPGAGTPMPGAVKLIEDPCAERTSACEEKIANRFARHLATGFGLAASSQTISAAGFDPAAMRLVPAGTLDLMNEAGDQGPRWISAANSEALFRGRPPSSLDRSRPVRAAEYVVVSGWIRRDGAAARLDPAYRITSSRPGPPAESGGGYCLRFTVPDAAPEYCFALDTRMEGDEVPFAIRAAWPSGATRVALIGSGSELAAVSAAASAPVVEFFSPQPAERWEGKQIVRWSAFDPAGSSLTYALLYSSDNGASWLPLAADLNEAQYELDCSLVAGGPQVLFRVLATSGLSTSTATVGPVELVQAPQLKLPAERIDLPNTAVGQTLERSLNVANPGTGPLDLTGTLTGNTAFSVTAPSGPFVVPAQGQATVAFRYSPQAEGRQLGLYSLAGAGASADVVLSGAAFARLVPSISVSPAALDFGQVDTGKTKDLLLAVRNDGSGDLSVTSAVSGGSAFTASGAPLSVAPGAARNLTVRFAPASAGSVSTRLTVASDDPVQPSLQVPLSGTGVGSPVPPPPPPPPPPTGPATVQGLVPSAIVAGARPFLLTVLGSNFGADSKVLWNGVERQTTFDGAGQLRARIAAADVASPGSARVSVGTSSAAFSIYPDGTRLSVHQFQPHMCPTMNVILSALDQVGLPITAVNSTQLQCIDDSVVVRCGVRTAREADSHLSVVIVIDTSLASAAELGSEKIAANGFINGLDEGDRVAILQVGATSSVVQGFTLSRVALTSTVNNLTPGASPGAALYDGLIAALRSLAYETWRRQAIVVLSAADNSAGPTRDPAAVYSEFLAAGIPVFTAQFGSGGGESLSSFLNQVAVMSEGRFYPAGLTDLQAERLGRILADQLVVQFEPQARDGKLHSFGALLRFFGQTANASRIYTSCR